MAGIVATEMFWVAEYKNGLALPEYDEFTGRTNPFSHVNHKDVLRFWWLPITPKMVQMFPNTRHNPLLKRHSVELKGSKGFVTRRMLLTLKMGKQKDLTKEELCSMFDGPTRVKCYILGIEKGPRREIYPDGTVVDHEWNDKGETQDILHHG